MIANRMADPRLPSHVHEHKMLEIAERIAATVERWTKQDYSLAVLQAIVVDAAEQYANHQDEWNRQQVLVTGAAYT